MKTLKIKAGIPMSPFLHAGLFQRHFSFYLFSRAPIVPSVIFFLFVTGFFLPNQVEGQAPALPISEFPHGIAFLGHSEDTLVYQLELAVPTADYGEVSRVDLKISFPHLLLTPSEIWVDGNGGWLGNDWSYGQLRFSRSTNQLVLSLELSAQPGESSYFALLKMLAPDVPERNCRASVSSGIVMVENIFKMNGSQEARGTGIRFHWDATEKVAWVDWPPNRMGTLHLVTLEGHEFLRKATTGPFSFRLPSQTSQWLLYWVEYDDGKVDRGKVWMN